MSTSTLTPEPQTQLDCPGCGFSASVSGDIVGKRVTCPRCQRTFEAEAAEALIGPVSSDSGRRATFADRRCPVCFGEVLRQPTDQRGSELVENRCSSCCGSLLEGDSAHELVSQHLGISPEMLSELESFSRKTPLECPSCNRDMQLLRVKGIDVDRCPECEALWLDGGELAQLTAGDYGAVPDKKAAASSPALESVLADLPRMKIRQDAEIRASTLLLGWDHANYYDLRGPLGSIGVVAEKGQGVGSSLVRNLLQSRRPLEAQWIDRSGSNVLLEIDRPAWLFSYTMQVKSPALGRTVGRITRHFSPIVRSYTLEDAIGRPFARIASPLWRFWTFPVLVDGAPVANIRKRWSGLFKEFYTRGDDFDLDFGAHPWTLDQKCLLVATAIAIDLDSFERQPGG